MSNDSKLSLAPEPDSTEAEKALKELFNDANMTTREQNLYKIGFLMVKNHPVLSRMGARERAVWIEGFINGNNYRMRREMNLVRQLDEVHKQMFVEFFAAYEKTLAPKEG